MSRSRVFRLAIQDWLLFIRLPDISRAKKYVPFQGFKPKIFEHRLSGLIGVLISPLATLPSVHNDRLMLFHQTPRREPPRPRSPEQQRGSAQHVVRGLGAACFSHENPVAWNASLSSRAFRKPYKEYHVVFLCIYCKDLQTIYFTIESDLGCSPSTEGSCLVLLPNISKRYVLPR